VTLFVVWAGSGEAPETLASLVGDRANAVGDPRSLMQARDRQSEAIARTGVPHKFDVTLPLSSLAAFTDEVRAAVPYGASLFLFGHLGDGNLHVNVVGPAPDDVSVDEWVLHCVARHGGSISAEHGIGRAKARWLHLSRSTTEVAAMQMIKGALDPDGILNPGVLFPEGST
jgi:FAD/FMN-containing dehydrogenase